MNNPNNSLLQLSQCSNNTLTNLKQKLTANSCNWVHKSFNPIAFGNEADIYQICCNDKTNCNYIIKHILPPKKSSDTEQWQKKIEKEIDINIRYPKSLKPIDICGCFEHGIFIVYEKRQFNLIDYILYLKKQPNISTKFMLEQIYSILFELIDPEKTLKKYINSNNQILFDDDISKKRYLDLSKDSIIRRALKDYLVHGDIQKQNIMFNINPDNTINLDTLCLIDFGKSYINTLQKNDEFIIKEIDKIVISFNKYVDFIMMDYEQLKKLYDNEKKSEKENRELKIAKQNKSRSYNDYTSNDDSLSNTSTSFRSISFNETPKKLKINSSDSPDIKNKDNTYFLSFGKIDNDGDNNNFLNISSIENNKSYSEESNNDYENDNFFSNKKKYIPLIKPEPFSPMFKSPMPLIKPEQFSPMFKSPNSLSQTSDKQLNKIISSTKSNNSSTPSTPSNNTSNKPSYTPYTPLTPSNNTSNKPSYTPLTPNNNISNKPLYTPSTPSTPSNNTSNKPSYTPLTPNNNISNNFSTPFFDRTNVDNSKENSFFGKLDFSNIKKK